MKMWTPSFVDSQFSTVSLDDYSRSRGFQHTNLIAVSPLLLELNSPRLT